MATMRAYDYDAQRWVKGREAAVLIAGQQRELADILRGARVVEYMRMVGDSRSVAAALQAATSAEAEALAYIAACNAGVVA